MSCPRCQDMTLIDPVFLEETKSAFAQLTVDLVLFCKKHKIDHTDLAILPDIARAIRIMESL